MNVEIRQVPAMHLVGMRHVGPYWGIGEAFRRLGEWMKSSGLRWGAMVAVYQDDPREVPEAQLRSDACTEIPAEVEITDPLVDVLEIPAGEYACARHRGPYSGLPAAWGEFLGGISSTGRSPACGPSFEIYVNDCASVPAEELITDLYQPVGPA